MTRTGMVVDGSLVGALVRVVLGTFRPTVGAVALSAVVVMPLGALAGQALPAMLLLAWIAGAFLVSCVAHEAGHLAAMWPALARARRSDRHATSPVPVLQSDWFSLRLVGAESFVTPAAAAVGPGAGVLACLAMAPYTHGTCRLVLWLVGLMHLVNLTSWCPDGQVIRDGRAARVRN